VIYCGVKAIGENTNRSTIVEVATEEKEYEEKESTVGIYIVPTCIG